MARNILLVSVDSLRADRCGSMAAGSSRTPALDELAADGIVFENAVAPGPNTPSSMPAVFTGNHIHGIDAGIAMRDTIRKHVGRSPTLPERLSDRGYTTIGYTPNPFTSRFFGFDRGFDRFEDFLSSRSRLRTRIVSRWMEGRFIAGLRFGLNMLGLGDLTVTWEDYYDDLLSTVREVEEPFFLWVFLLEPHWPYYPPKRFRGDSSVIDMFYQNWRRSKVSSSSMDPEDIDRLRSLYEGSIRHVDEFLSRIIREFNEWDPIIVFHSDHGEGFGEHGMFGHGQQLYEENIHVPLVIGNVDQQEVIDEPVSLCTIPDMITDLADSGKIMGEEYSDWYVLSHAVQKHAIRGQSWKYIRNPEEGGFYHLDSDPKERNQITDSSISDMLEQLSNQQLREKVEWQQLHRVIDELDLSNL